MLVRPSVSNRPFHSIRVHSNPFVSPCRSHHPCPSSSVHSCRSDRPLDSVPCPSGYVRVHPVPSIRVGPTAIRIRPSRFNRPCQTKGSIPSVFVRPFGSVRLPLCLSYRPCSSSSVHVLPSSSMSVRIRTSNRVFPVLYVRPYPSVSVRFC